MITTGGMQDYNYIFHGTMEITLEVSCCKHPMASTLRQHWQDNRKVKSRRAESAAGTMNSINFVNVKVNKQGGIHDNKTRHFGVKRPT